MDSGLWGRSAVELAAMEVVEASVGVLARTL